MFAGLPGSSCHCSPLASSAYIRPIEVAADSHYLDEILTMLLSPRITRARGVARSSGYITRGGAPGTIVLATMGFSQIVRNRYLDVNPPSDQISALDH
jgi:hypothetical protein